MNDRHLDRREASEIMEVSIKGTVEKLNPLGWSSIVGTDGEKYIFYSGTCIGGIEAFNSLHQGTRVIFNGETSKHLKNTIDNETDLGKAFKLAYENGFDLMAVNVAIDYSGETSVLIPETESAVVTVLHTNNTEVI